MEWDQNLNQTPPVYKWDGEPPGPAPAYLSPFVIRLFPSVNETFHPPAGQSHFAAYLSAPGGDCDILPQPVYSVPFLFCVSPAPPGINDHRSCA